MNASMRRVAAVVLGLLFALALAPFVTTQTAHAASPVSWFDYDIRGEEGEYGPGAYITGLTGTPDGEVIPGSFWDTEDENLTLPATLPDQDGNQIPVVYAQIPNGYAIVFDATEAEDLRYLCCAAGEVETLLVSHLPNLEILECSENYLEKLDLRGCTALRQLSCRNNYLTTLNLSSCTNLEYLDCTNNMIEDTSVLEGITNSSLSAVEPQRQDISTAQVTVTNVPYDGTSWFWDQDPVARIVMPDGTELTPYNYEELEGDFYADDMQALDADDKNGNYNRAGRYLVTFKALGLEETSCAYYGTVVVPFTITQIPLTTAMVTVPNKAYNGLVQKPAPTVKAKGLTQKSGEFKTMYYNKNRNLIVSPKNVGTYYAKVSSKTTANTKGAVWKKFLINPEATANLKLTALNNGFKAGWTKRTVQVTGYQVQYRMKGKTTWNTKWVTNCKTGTKSVTGLKDKKTYQVRVRTYKTVDGVKYYSTWTPIKTVKTR